MDINLIIRQFKEEDIPDVIRLWKKSFPTDPPWNDPQDVVQRKMNYQRELFLVGESQGRVAGQSSCNRTWWL
jgi:hypothetical protein